MLVAKSVLILEISLGLVFSVQNRSMSLEAIVSLACIVLLGSSRWVVEG